MTTLQQVKDVFEGQEPGRGGYGSKFTFEEHKDGVVVTLLADWAPRYSEPKVLVTTLTDGQVTFRFPDGFGNWDEERTQDASGLCEHLADQASEG